jgi:hypothetical protein
MNASQIQLSEKPTESAYTITLAPEKVRYLKFSDFLCAKVGVWIDFLRGLSSQPIIHPPIHAWKGFNLEAIDALCPREKWDTRLRIHHALGKLYFKHDAPTNIYASFHEGLKLNNYNYEEFINAWVMEVWASNNWQQRDSLAKSPDHIRLGGYIYRKTSFVLARLIVIAKEDKRLAAKAEIEAKRIAKESALAAKKKIKEEANKKATEDLELLRKSKFTTFVYLMEDLRKGRFKIGRSKTPGKRERTLQAEVPEIVLRFSIPADDEHESQLHDHFSNKRVRGEWFSMSPDDLLWLVSFLKRNGDFARASVDYQWLGTMCFHSPTDSKVN